MLKKLWRLAFEGYHTANGALNARVLLLNQSYEPLIICNVKKAIILILLGKAELVADNEKKRLRSVSSSFPWPSVIRLNSYVRVPYKRIIISRKNILKRDGHKCAYCGRGHLPLTLDHIVPKSRGGEDTWDNLIAACIRCNNKKGDRTPKEAGMEMLFQPHTPSHIMIIKNAAGRLDESWKPYLFQS